jgi:replicative DNA helicase
LIRSPELLADVAGLLHIRAFVDPRHQRIYAALAHLFKTGKNPDLVILSTFLKQERSLPQVGGDPYLAELASRRESDARTRAYAYLVAEDWMRRQQGEVAREVLGRVKSFDDPFEIAADTSTAIFKILSRTSDKEPRRLSVGLSERIDEVTSGTDKLSGISTGIPELDAITGGFHPSELTIVAARPSIGKTSLAVRLAYEAAEAGYRPVIFSAEMSLTQLQDRFLSLVAKVDVHSIRTRRLTADQIDRIYAARPTLDALNILIDDTPSMAIGTILAKARALSIQERADIVFVDYIQIIRGERPKGSNREQEIAMISSSLKSLAKEVGVPVVGLAQLSREVEKRRDKKPQLADLRESGAIEQDADNVIMIHRPSRYGFEYTPDGEITAGKAWLLIEKQRSGPVGQVRVAFVEKYADFQPYALKHFEAAYEPEEPVF